MNSDDRKNYEYAFDLRGPTAAAKVVRMVGKNKKVLEIGAGPGSITKHLVNTGKCKVTALEIDKDAIKKLSQFTSEIYPADLNDENWPQIISKSGLFEVIVGADVLEHLYDPWKTLTLMKSLLSEDGYVVISLPHIGHSAICACLMNEDFDYRDWGLLDRTHIRFFGLKNIQNMFEKAGLTISHAEFVIKRPEHTEFAKSWYKLSKHVRNALLENHYGSVYQVVIQASLNKSSDKSINLLSLPIEFPPRNTISNIKFLAATFLPASIKKALKYFS